MKKPPALLVSFILAFSFLQIDCKKDTISTPTENTPDTTSHNFTFTSYTFGGTGGSSYFKDVAIINDSDIWAVGGIFISPDTSYNAAHWNGKKWELKQIKVALNGNMIMPYLEGAFAFSATDIWFVGSFPIHGNGSEWTMYHLQNMGIGASVSKGWGIKTNAMFFVGSNGSIVYYNGLSWAKQESGTTIDLRDVWGSVDGKTVWACGYSNDNSKSILLKYDGATWQTVWSSNPKTPPYGGLITSLWGDKHLYLVGTDGAFKQDIAGNDSVEHLFSLTHFPYRINGSAENNIAFVGDFGMIWHYNGSTWKSIYLTTSGHPLYSVAVSKNMIVAVGSDYDIGFGAGLIYVGKR